MNKTIKELIKDIVDARITGSSLQIISSLCLDSRKVLPGALFIAISGQKDDGINYIDEAIKGGAVAVMTSKPYRGFQDIVVIQVNDVRSAMAQVARCFYNYPDESLHLIGITGTNGKTTVATISQFLLNEIACPAGMLSTVYYDLGRRTLPAMKTTPEALDIHAMFDQMLQDGCKVAVMEVTSHGIALKRVQSIAFDIAVFLNLTQDHLDFHGDMETYFNEKVKIFTGQTGKIPKVAIINIDDPYGLRLLQKVPPGVRIITFGISPHALIRARNFELTEKGLRFSLYSPEGEFTIESTLLGAYNISNILASLAVGWASGRNIEYLATKLIKFPGVRGRMEKVDAGQDFLVLVDFAHTEDALSNALKMLRLITSGRLLVVFGCGGERDFRKRSLMTTTVQQWADFAWATADNPRGEALENIFKDMSEGVTSPEKILFVPERRRAIDRALEEASTGDCVLIAGRGHEPYQEIACRAIPFDDCKVARELLTFKNKFNACV